MKRHRRHKDDEPSFKDYILAELRAAHIRARMLVKEIETIGVAVRGNVIEPDTAIEWMAEAFMMRFLQRDGQPPSAEVDRLQAALVSIGMLNSSGGKFDIEIDRIVREAAPLAPSAEQTEEAT